MRKMFKSAMIVLLSLSFPCSALAATKVVVDAGHGAKDPGATGVNGEQEKTHNLDVADRLTDELLRRGYEVAMTRNSDVFLSLSERVAFADAQKADLFVSIHANSYSNSSMNGSLVLYYDNAYPQADYPASEAMNALTPWSKRLARTVLDAMVGQVQSRSLGIEPSAVYVVRKGTIPSILVETGFLSNAAEAAKLAQPAYRQQLAVGIANGIENYEPAILPDTAGHWARQAILRLYDKKIVEGDGNRYYPESKLTRAELVTMLDRVFSFDKMIAAGKAVDACAKPETAKTGCAFSDLTAAHWAYAAIQKAVALGILQGNGDGTVQPDRSITREETALVLDRILHPNGKPVAAVTGFTDVPATAEAAPSIYRLKAAGIIDGTSPTTFEPKLPITRAETASMLDRYVTQAQRGK